MRSWIVLLVLMLVGMAPCNMRGGPVSGRDREAVWHGPVDRSASREFVKDSGTVSVKPVQGGVASSYGAPDCAVSSPARVFSRIGRARPPEDPCLVRSAWVGVVELRI